MLDRDFVTLLDVTGTPVSVYHFKTQEPETSSTQLTVRRIQHIMRVRIRGPSGQSTVTLSDSDNVGDLQAKITEATSISNLSIKYGYPPEPLDIKNTPSSKLLSDLGIKLNGETLIVSDATPQPSSSRDTAPTTPASSSKSVTSPKPPAKSQAPPKDMGMDSPEVAIASHSSTLVLRVMPDDNSCLFRAFNSAFFGAMDNMQELRSIIAQTIQANRDSYPKVVLETEPDDYCRWIQSPDSWGGAIELGILSQHFDIEICSIDVQSLRVDKFNEGKSKRCILVYSGIHYDVIALSPSDEPFEKSYAPHEFDTKVFDSFDEEVLQKSVELCRDLQKQHYYTDTAGFAVKCNVCGGMFQGEKGATEHAKKTGHYDFGEAAA